VRWDIQELYAALVGRTKHLFDLNSQEQYAAFLSLAQHHGYPTPLLDWTLSPFVAAFFAFRRARATDDGTPVRIFMFDQKRWRDDFDQLKTIAYAAPHFSLLQALAIENPRAQPQQALSGVSNVNDIEAYIRGHEDTNGATYLTVFDLPYTDRRAALESLEWMGVTAGSLFPGVDGACEDLRARHFGY
jgi:hypothetical protein